MHVNASVIQYLYLYSVNSNIDCEDIFTHPLQPPFYSRDVAEMYDGILFKPLRLPPGKSDAVCHLLQELLQKDPRQRLGATADFVSDL